MTTYYNTNSSYHTIMTTLYLSTTHHMDDTRAYAWDGCGGSSVQCRWGVHYFKVLYLHCHCVWLLQKSPFYALVLLFQYPAVLSVDPVTLAVPVQVHCCKRTKCSNNAICTYISQRESIGVIHWVSGGNKVELGLGGFLAQYVTIRSKYSPDPIFKLVDLA